MLLLPKNATTMLALEHTGMSAHVKETEGTSTSTEERDDLLIRNLGNTKLIAFWTCVLRILMHHPTFIGNRKQSFFPMNVKRRRKTSKPVWTNAVTSPPTFVLYCCRIEQSHHSQNSVHT